MTATTARRAPRSATRRHVLFRIVAVLLALVLVVMFGVWQSILTPWVALPDPADHGWTRTPELHRHADSAAAVAMAAMGVGALVAALRPAGRSGLVAWVAAMLAVVGVGSGVSVLLQQHQGLVGALVQGVVTVAVTAAPFVLLHPERRRVLRGGEPVDAGPRGVVRSGLVVLAVAGTALAAGAVVRRVAGVLAENPREDDVISFVILGLAMALGSAICLAGRAGWRPLAMILGGVTLYGVVGAVSLTLA